MQQGARKSDIEKSKEEGNSLSKTVKKNKNNQNIGKSSGQQKQHSSSDTDNDEEIEVKIDFEKLQQEAQDELQAEQFEASKLSEVQKLGSLVSSKSKTIVLTNTENKAEKTLFASQKLKAKEIKAQNMANQTKAMT